MIRRGVWVVLLVAACSPSTPEPPPAPAAPPDAAVDAAIVEIVDEPADEPETPPARRRGAKRPSRPVDIMLRSTPSGAVAYVDSARIGPTPAYWSGEADGRVHEFMFEKAGFGIARYRFVVVQSGLVHARLDPVVRPRPPGQRPVVPSGGRAPAPSPAKATSPAPPRPDASVPASPDTPPTTTPTPAPSADPVDKRPPVGPQP